MMWISLTRTLLIFARKVGPIIGVLIYVSRVGRKKPQKLTQLSPRSHPRHLVGKRTAQKDAIKDITSDSQVKSYFSNRWSPASLTINTHTYTHTHTHTHTYIYISIPRITINNDTPHVKSLKNQNRRAALGRPALKILGTSIRLRSTNPRL